MTIWMNEALAAVHGVEQKVQLPHTALLSSLHEYYNELAHKGALTCSHCSAKVHFNKGAVSGCGSNVNGASPHFHTNPGHNHDDDCLWPLRMDEGQEDGHEGRAYDMDKGYRIHLNTSPSHPAYTSPLYSHDEDGKLRVHDEDLKDREPFSIKGIDDLLKLIKKGEFNRLLGSRVIFREFDLKWQEFFIRRDKTIGDKRYYDLLTRLNARQEHPVFMEFNLKAGAQIDMFKRNKSIKGKALYLKTDDYDRKHWIIPRLWLETENTHVTHAFGQAGSYMIMAQARLNTRTNKTSVVHFIDMIINTPDQIAHISARQLANQARITTPQ